MAIRPVGWHRPTHKRVYHTRRWGRKANVSKLDALFIVEIVNGKRTRRYKRDITATHRANYNLKAFYTRLCRPRINAANKIKNK